jgi:hypothetical protein
MTERTQFHPGYDPPAIDEGRGQDADTASVRDRAAESARGRSGGRRRGGAAKAAPRKILLRK